MKDASVGPRSGNAFQMKLPTSSLGNRRVHDEGMKMLENHYHLIEEKMKMEKMENRINRLEFEEKRA